MVDPTPPLRYPGALRAIHWTTAALIIVTVPIGLVMAARGAAGVFDGLTNFLYSWHKAIGFTILTLAIIRVLVKARSATPPYPASLAPVQVMAAKGLHHLLYLMLFLVPLTGWAGVTAFPALDTIAGLKLPAMPFVPQDEALATRIFGIHKIVAIGLAMLVLGHIGAALLHLVIIRDGVFQRMWSGR